MTRNQFLTDANAYLEAISPNYAKSTMDEKSRKLRYYARVFYTLHLDGRIRTNAPSKLTADDLHTYVTFRRSRGVKDSTIAKDLSIIGMFLRWKGNDAKEIYDVQYGNRKPHAYNGKLDPLSDDVIERVYALARETDSWQVLEGCVAIILGCAAGLRPQESRQLYASDVHLMGDKSTIFVQHVKGEGTWGRRRSVPVMDGVEDVLERYLSMRAEKLRSFGIESDAMFPSFRSDREFMRQQSFGRLKERVERILGVRFELRDGRRAYGQRMLNAGYPIELVSKSMGHASIETTQKFYADYQERNVLDRIFQMKNDQKIGTKT